MKRRTLDEVVTASLTCPSKQTGVPHCRTSKSVKYEGSRTGPDEHARRSAVSGNRDRARNGRVQRPASRAGEEHARQRGERPTSGAPTEPSERARTLDIAGKGGHELTLRVIAPDRPQGVYLHFHGGGFVSGSAEQSDRAFERIAQNTGLACIDVNYRLAPAHPYPAAWDDAEAAAMWLIENARTAFGTDALAIGGVSAGATLAAAVLVRLRERLGCTVFQAANLVFGNFDLSMTPSQTLLGADAVPVTTDNIRACTDAVAPRTGLRRDPDLSPMFADLRDLPAALFTVGTLDPFLDDTLFMHSRWVAAEIRPSWPSIPAAHTASRRFPSLSPIRRTTGSMPFCKGLVVNRPPRVLRHRVPQSPTTAESSRTSRYLRIEKFLGRREDVASGPNSARWASCSGSDP